jgi:RNA polymerase sigma factor (sigma-70 family)
MLPNLNQADLHDCISEVYKVALQAENIETRPNIHGWLNLTAKNISKRFKEKQAILGRISSFEEISEDLIVSENFMDRIESEELDTEFLSAIKNHLKVGEYILFELKFLKGKTNAEIAESTGLGKRSVDMRMTRLIKKLRKYFEKT